MNNDTYGEASREERQRRARIYKQTNNPLDKIEYLKWKLTPDYENQAGWEFEELCEIIEKLVKERDELIEWLYKKRESEWRNVTWYNVRESEYYRGMSNAFSNAAWQANWIKWGKKP